MMVVAKDIFIGANIVGAILIGQMMVIVTPLASISRSWHDPQAMWGMLRRLFYLLIAGGMMGKGLFTLAGEIDPSPIDMICWLMIVIPLGGFLVLRAGGFVNQDQWVPHDRRVHGRGRRLSD